MFIKWRPLNLSFRAHCMNIGHFFVFLTSFCTAFAQTQDFQADTGKAVTSAHELLKTFDTKVNLRLTPKQKNAVLENISLIIQELDQIAPSTQPDGVRRSHIVGLENSLMALDDRVRAETSQQILIESQVSFGQPSSQWNQRAFGLGISLFVDGGRHFDWYADLGSMSVLRESDGLLALPVQEADVFAVRSAWIKLKTFNTVQLKLGMFEDEESLIKPKYWSFLSTQGLVKVVTSPWLRASLRARHDRFSYLSPRANSTTPIQIERNLSELILTQNSYLSGLRLTSKLSYGIHWYSDPDKQLKTLLLGQNRYSALRSDAPNVGYRVSNFVGALQLWKQDVPLVDLQGELWLNHLATGSAKNAEIFQAKLSTDPIFAGVLQFSRLGETCLPIIASAPNFKAGPSQWRWGLEGNTNVSSALNIFWKMTTISAKLGTLSLDTGLHYVLE
jgi:hypothetical protein